MSQKSLQDWAKTIRIESLKMIHHSPAGHPGGSLSVADIIAVLYFSELRLKPEEPRWLDRDRCILSKGHACAAVYAALGLLGYFDQKEFLRFRRIDGLLEGHPSVAIPGIDAPSGSLGMGLSQGLGMALGARFGKRDFRTYVVLGEGDLQEGSTWEAIMAAGHHKVSSLCAILDLNGVQQDGRVEDTMNIAPIADKLEAFHWAVQEVDGHDCDQIAEALKRARSETGKPTLIVARTIKGKGVSFMEHQVRWHGSTPLSAEQLEASLAELNC
ncbi:transketolase [Prosthecobacter debontii]|uniref:Transketolase n=1 Tax=Prosthecobacter debontii TaxID=48467 RepID=A0A1T4XTK7_9BACT|nr:transketolase [Prosthecobacter debontii]SKA92854.1 transketolase [Prosthecobacter debontii]